MIPTKIQPYSGTLRLDNTKRASFLVQRNSVGQTVTTLMMMDTPPTGNFSKNAVTAAWQYFSDRNDLSNGGHVTVYGLWNYPPDSDIPVLHIIRA